MSRDEKVLHKLTDTLSVYQYKEGFSFGTDAVLLSAFIRLRKGEVGGEIGTGTGVIPILVCKRKDPKKIYTFEIQKDYVDLARENVGLCGMSDRIEVIHGDVKSITFKYLEEKGIKPLDFVFSNPPYMKVTSGKMNPDERKLIARHEEKCDIFDVCRGACVMLKNGGRFFVVYRPDRLCDLFVALRENGLEPKEMTEVHSFEGDRTNLVLVMAIKGAKSDLKINKPFVIYKSEGVYTEMAEKVYNESGMK